MANKKRTPKTPSVVFDLFNRAMARGDTVHSHVGISGRIVDIYDYKVVSPILPFHDTFMLDVEDEYMNVYPLVGKQCAMIICDPKNGDLPGRENDEPEVAKLKKIVDAFPLFEELNREYELELKQEREDAARRLLPQGELPPKTPDTLGS
jgi:hypothetical protein